MVEYSVAISHHHHYRSTVITKTSDEQRRRRMPLSAAIAEISCRWFPPSSSSWRYDCLVVVCKTQPSSFEMQWSVYIHYVCSQQRWNRERERKEKRNIRNDIAFFREEKGQARNKNRNLHRLMMIYAAQHNSNRSLFYRTEDFGFIRSSLVIKSICIYSVSTYEHMDSNKRRHRLLGHHEDGNTSRDLSFWE